MATKENLTIRVEPELKQEVSNLFKSLGLDLSTATGIFYRQALRCNGLPFRVIADEPNATTYAAMEEAEKMLNDPDAKTYSDLDDLFEDLGI